MSTASRAREWDAIAARAGVTKRTLYSISAPRIGSWPKRSTTETTRTTCSRDEREASLRGDRRAGDPRALRCDRERPPHENEGWMRVHSTRRSRINRQAILFVRPRWRICALGRDSFANSSPRRAWKTPTWPPQVTLLVDGGTPLVGLAGPAAARQAKVRRLLCSQAESSPDDQ